MSQIQEEKRISGANESEIARVWRVLQERHSKSSRNLHYRIGAALLGFFYFGLIFVLAVFIRLIGGRQENETAHQLGLLHSYVPEMAIQKTVELEALSENDVSGKGLDLGCGNGFTGSVFMGLIGANEYHGIDRQAGFKSPLELGYSSLTVGESRLCPMPTRHLISWLQYASSNIYRR